MTRVKIPRPNKRVGPKERANLKKTAGPGRPRMTKQQKSDASALRDFGRRVLTDAAVRRAIWNNLRGPRPNPQILLMLSQYGFGKPPDTLEVKGTPTAVTIIHKLRGDKKDDEDE